MSAMLDLRPRTATRYPRPAVLKLSRLDHEAKRATLRATIMRERRPEGRWFAIVELLGTGMPAEAIIYQPTHAEAVQAALALLALVERIAMDEVHASRASRRDTRPTCTKLPGIHPAEECDAIPDWCSGCLDRGPHTYGPGCDYRTTDQIITTEEPS